MKIKAVLFDLDGTLLDTKEFVYQAYEHTLSSHGFEIYKREELAQLIGGDIFKIYTEIAPAGNPQVLATTHFNFQAKRMDLIKSYPYIFEVVNKIKKLGIKVGVVTSRRTNTKQTLEAGNLGGLFDVIITADQVSHHKPNPEGLHLALKKLKVKYSETLFVGDAAVDVEMGKKAKVKTVGVTWGFGGKNIKKSKPDYIIDDIKELLTFL